MATPTVSQAESWQPNSLDGLAAEWRRHGDAVAQQVDQFKREVDGTRQHWSGEGADKSRTKADQIETNGTAIARALGTASDAARAAANSLAEAKNAAVSAVNAARAEQFIVTDDGSVSPSPAMIQTAVAALGERAAATIALMKVKAGHHEDAIKSALKAFGRADEQAAAAIKSAFAEIDGDPTTQPQSPSDPWPNRAVTGATAGLGEASKIISETVMPSGAHAAVRGSVLERVAAEDALKTVGRVSFLGGVTADIYGGFQDWEDGKASASEATVGVVGSVGGGAAGGALAGAAVGSFFGPVGTGVGAGVGAIIGSEIGKQAAQGLWHALGGD